MALLSAKRVAIGYFNPPKKYKGRSKLFNSASGFACAAQISTAAIQRRREDDVMDARIAGKTVRSTNGILPKSLDPQCIWISM